MRIKHLLQKLEVESSGPQHSRKCQVDIVLFAIPAHGSQRSLELDPQSWIVRVTGLADSGFEREALPQ